MQIVSELYILINPHLTCGAEKQHHKATKDYIDDERFDLKS